jgi:hypothetical protein
MKTQLLAFFAALLALTVSVLTIVSLLGVRTLVASRLDSTAEVLRSLTEATIDTTIAVKQTMPLEAEINISRPTIIDLDLKVQEKIPVKLDVKVRENLTVPIALDIDEMIDLDSHVRLRDDAKVNVKADLHLEQPVQWRLGGMLKPLLNIRSTVPVDHEVEIDFPDKLTVKGKIPVKLPLREEIQVPVDINVPVSENLDLALAIKQHARVGFPEPLLISGDIPVIVQIPVSIPLRDTPIGPALEKLAAQLDQLLAP